MTPAVKNIVLRSGLLTPDKLPGLAAWYDASDSSTVLTQVGGATAFAKANSQYLSIASGSSVKFDSSFTFTLWVYPTAGMTNYAGILSDQYPGFLEGNTWYLIAGPSGPTQVYCGVRLSGGPITTGLSMSTWTTDAWNFVVFDYDDSTKKCSVTVNNGTRCLSSAGTGTIVGADRAFQVGKPGSVADYADGKIDEITFHKRVLTADERTWLYNSGAGRTYSEADASMKTNLVSWWSMAAPATGDWQDQHGDNDLTPSASRPTATEGVTFGVATDGQTVRRWLDKSGNGRHLDQATLANQPTLTSRKVVFNGTSSKMRAASVSAVPFTQYLACVPTRSGISYNVYVDGATDDRATIYSGPQTGDDIAQPKMTSVAFGTGGATSKLIAIDQMTAWSGKAIIMGGVLNGASSRFRMGSFSISGDAGTVHPNGFIMMGAAGGGSFYAPVTVMEYVSYAAALSEADEAKLAKYFARKWGVAI